MKESEWLSSTSPQEMLEFLRGLGQTNDRRLRLFAVACMREVLPMVDVAGRHNTVLTERFADGRMSERQWTAAVCRKVLDRDISVTFRCGEGVDEDNARERQRGLYSQEVRRVVAKAARLLVNYPPGEAATQVAAATALAVGQAARQDPSLAATWRRTPLAQRTASWAATKEVDRRAAEAGARNMQACFLRDIFNPFRKMASVDTSCLTPSVLALAQEAYYNPQSAEGPLDPARLTARVQSRKGVKVSGLSGILGDGRPRLIPTRRLRHASLHRFP
ncbi:MAG TPA: hypothetical protein VKA46_02860, partial [Gemmataceae bacterium]|nr:hypothetical protein [Gemmataceae bacterium]